MFNERIAIRVGAALSVLLILSVVVALRVDFRSLGPAIRVNVYLKHPGPLRAPADVQLGGRKVGRVDSIRLVTAQEASVSGHLLHPAGGVVLSVLVRKKYLPWVRRNSEIFVNAKGLIGESYLEIAPPPATEEMQRPLVKGDEIRGIDPARMEEIIVTSFQNAERFAALLKELRPSMLQLRNDLTALDATLNGMAPAASQAWDGMAQTSAEYDLLLGTLEDLPSLAGVYAQSQHLALSAQREFGATSRALDQLTMRLHAVKNRVPKDLWDKLAQATTRATHTLARLEATIAKVEELSERVASGIGTVGALINDKEFSDDTKKLGRYIKRHPWELLVRPAD